MRIALRASSIVSLVLLTTCLALSQGKQSLNTDVLRDQIRKLESISVDCKSASVQSIHRRALQSLYTQFQTAIDQEIEDLKNIQGALGSSSAEIQLEIVGQLRKLAQENAAAGTKLKDLVAGLPAGASSEASSDQSMSIPIANQPETEPVDIRTQLAQPRGAAVSDPVNARANDLVPQTLPAGLTPAAPALGNGGTQAGTGAVGPASTSLNADLNNRVREAARARIQQRETTKQAETPSVSSSSASLVDTSSAGDLVNVGLGLAGLSKGTNTNSTNSNSVSITTSAYALYAASQAADPLNPGFYNRNAGWRRLSLTLGYDDEKLKTGATQRAQIFGAKYLIIDKRDPSLDRHKADFKMIGNNLEKAAIAFGNLDEKVSYYFSTNRTVKEKILIPQFRVFLNERLTSLQSLTPAAESEKQKIQDDKDRITTLLQRVDSGRLFILNSNGVPPNRGESGRWTPEELEFYAVNFRNPYLGADYRGKLKEAVGQQVLDDLDAFIAQQLTDTRAFEDLSDTTRDALERIRRAPQFSFYFLTKQRPEGDDEYTGETIFDYGVANRINLTLNGNYIYKDSKIIGGDTRGAKFAGQFRFQMTPEKLTGRNPLFLSVSGDGEAFSGRKPAFHAQAKLTIPILNGLDLPFSVTYANQKGLIKENKIRGQFGFSIDTSRLLEALTLK
jgi:hypothetical protein